jgi:hypothetical protein
MKLHELARGGLLVASVQIGFGLPRKVLVLGAGC